MKLLSIFFCLIFSSQALAFNNYDQGEKLMIGISFSNSGNKNYFVKFSHEIDLPDSHPVKSKESLEHAFFFNKESNNYQINFNDLSSEKFNHNNQLNYTGYRNVEGYRNTKRQQDQTFLRSILGLGTTVLVGGAVAIIAIAGAL